MLNRQAASLMSRMCKCQITFLHQYLKVLVDMTRCLSQAGADYQRQCQHPRSGCKQGTSPGTTIATTQVHHSFTLFPY